ncbi:hypothetical protein [Aminicella lysinilytica]|uniref:Uncharacterized protein n=1 Tax=Aminicella lysinilytica TaxID=433323 RepID=A0A4V3CRD9_9FIRM|nr:hypothetical protein [Aminicella lysinilytica]NLD11538.1 hypothetical protein [Clostridiales bacterium]TDP56442.1 hypothetical protein EV211_11416 [Aminicella lysinilytica]
MKKNNLRREVPSVIKTVILLSLVPILAIVMYSNYHMGLSQTQIEAPSSLSAQETVRLYFYYCNVNDEAGRHSLWNGLVSSLGEPEANPDKSRKGDTILFKVRQVQDKRMNPGEVMFYVDFRNKEIGRASMYMKLHKEKGRWKIYTAGSNRGIIASYDRKVT